MIMAQKLTIMAAKKELMLLKAVELPKMSIAPTSHPSGKAITASSMDPPKK